MTIKGTRSECRTPAGKYSRYGISRCSWRARLLPERGSQKTPSSQLLLVPPSKPRCRFDRNNIRRSRPRKKRSMRKTLASVVARLYQVAGSSSVDHVEPVFFWRSEDGGPKGFGRSLGVSVYVERIRSCCVGPFRCQKLDVRLPSPSESPMSHQDSVPTQTLIPL